MLRCEEFSQFGQLSSSPHHVRFCIQGESAQRRFSCTLLCAAGSADSLCSAGRSAAAMDCFVDLRMADAAFFPMLFCIMLLYIAVRSCFTVLKSIGTCRTADGTTLVVDSRRSAGRNGFQILSIHSFLIVMRRQFTIIQKHIIRRFFEPYMPVPAQLHRFRFLCDIPRYYRCRIKRLFAC